LPGLNCGRYSNFLGISSTKKIGEWAYDEFRRRMDSEVKAVKEVLVQMEGIEKHFPGVYASRA
jgi:hypothetical protein